MKAEQLEALGRLKPAKVFTGLAILATVGFGVALTIWQASEAPAAPQVRRHHRANASPTPEPVAEGVAPAEAEQDSSWVQSWMSSWNSFLGNAMGGGQPEPIGVSVGDWKPGDPWPGGVECASGKLTDAFHMKPDKGCEPSCTQCQMVCLPSAFVGPFKNHGGELGSNCFERGCSQYKGSGSRSGVTFYMYDCDPALQQQWAEANAQLTHEQVEQRLEECLAECSRRDKQCQLACEATHKEELAEVTLRMHAGSGFRGEHGDAYQTATVMGFILMCAIIAGIAGCFCIHAHHTTKADGKSGKGTKGAVMPAANALSVAVEGKVIQIATGSDGQLCALTEDGRVYAWTADDAAKARGALEASLVENGVADAKLPADGKSQVPSTPTRPSAASYSQPKSPAKSPAPRPRGGKQSISELKKSVNTIRAVS